MLRQSNMRITGLTPMCQARTAIATAAPARPGAGIIALRSVLFTEHGTGGKPSLDDLLAALAPADIVLVEGFKREPIPKIEIYREAVGKGPLWLEDEWIIAAATDAQLEPQTDGAPAIILDLNDAAAIADLICGLADAEKPA